MVGTTNRSVAAIFGAWLRRKVISTLLLLTIGLLDAYAARRPGL